jgi:hypothetical protein
MNPTQEQIEAALRYANFQQTTDDYVVLANPSGPYNPDAVCMTILAAAYRAAIAENEELKAAILKLNQP